MNGNVDGEVSVDGAHLVAESESDTLDQVLDVGADSTDSSQFLSATEPLADTQDVLSFTRKVQGGMTEAASQNTTGTLYLNETFSECEGDIVGEHNGFAGFDLLHFYP